MPLKSKSKLKSNGWVMLAELPSVFTSGISEEEAAQHIALVVGNGAYVEKPLTHPIRDADDMAALLRGLDFEVTQATDLKIGELRKQVREFIDLGRERSGDCSSIWATMPAGHRASSISSESSSTSSELRSASRVPVGGSTYRDTLTGFHLTST
ncbi:MAG: caspase family protein [Candidatus Competibacter phosphatis]